MQHIYKTHKRVEPYIPHQDQDFSYVNFMKNSYEIYHRLHFASVIRVVTERTCTV